MFIVPKNSGLNRCKKIAKNFSKSKILEVRGEDVPLVVSRMSKNNKTIGITGEDLFKEFSLKNKKNNLEIIERKKWKDKSILFGKPTLCLLGPKNKNLNQFKGKIRVCINSKYKRIAKNYLNSLESKGYNFEKIYVSGASEEMFSVDMAELIIDIVYSGKSSEKFNLGVYDKIFGSDIVIIGKNQKDLVKTLNWEKMNGLIPTIIKDSQGNILTLVYSNKESLSKTLKEKNPYYFSRKREKIVRKGLTSGNKQELVEIKSDCDNDAILFIVRQKRNACHLNKYSCFGEKKKFDFEALYNNISGRIASNNKNSYTNKLAKNPNFLKRKIVEEAGEVITENPNNKERLIEEFADLFYNIFVYMSINRINIGDIERENSRRDKNGN